jgi:hypothetical protein
MESRFIDSLGSDLLAALPVNIDIYKVIEVHQSCGFEEKHGNN